MRRKNVPREERAGKFGRCGESDGDRVAGASLGDGLMWGALFPHRHAMTSWHERSQRLRRGSHRMTISQRTSTRPDLPIRPTLSIVGIRADKARRRNHAAARESRACCESRIVDRDTEQGPLERRQAVQPCFRQSTCHPEEVPAAGARSRFDTYPAQRRISLRRQSWTDGRRSFARAQDDTFGVRSFLAYAQDDTSG